MMSGGLFCLFDSWQQGCSYYGKSPYGESRTSTARIGISISGLLGQRYEALDQCHL